MAPTKSIRTATIEDAPVILDIYAYYVENTTISFEITAPDIKEMERRIGETLRSFDWIVGEMDGKVVGYAYYSKFRERKAYDFTCETTVYVQNDMTGKGIGSVLYSQLISRLKKSPLTVAIGGIALPNEASVRLHEKLGFKNAGILKNVGRKFNSWIDVGYWELELRNCSEYIPDQK